MPTSALKVEHPELVGPLGVELALHVILRPRRRAVGAGGEELLAAADAAQALLANEAFDRAAGDDDAVPGQ